MEVIPYDRSVHDAMVTRWCSSRGVPATLLDMLPERGFIVPDVAAGFLYQTDSTMALIEGIVANPKADSRIRDDALDQVFFALFDLARDLGFELVWGFSPRPEIETRARRIGFRIDEKRQYTFGSVRVAKPGA